MPKQVIVQSSIEAVEIIDTPIPTPRDKEVVVKVVVSGTNPKDWKYPLWYVFLLPVSSVEQKCVMLTFCIGRTCPTTAVMTLPALSIQSARTSMNPTQAIV